ncbi:MAG: 2Fe-2S iron-sulfur cluster-binding protein [Elioraea sp.]|nr:2Fe-2S iron-sulfur cluster-binding protein [Elioraea sp.]
MKRLAPVAGEWIDRTQPLTFTFDGRSYGGFAGDTITSALLASGQVVLGRSFKYHRPRSVLGFANTDANILVQIGRRLNVRADVEPLCDGLVVEPVNVEFGGLAHDRLAWLDRFSKALPAGFYYKAFYAKRWFPMWERLIRRTAGLGRLDPRTPRLATPKRYDHADVLVVGGGWSGLQAALTAAEEGANVLLVDENPRLGGSSFDARTGGPGLAALEALLAEIGSHPRIRTLTSSFAAGFYADQWVPVVGCDAIVKVRCRALVVAQGAWEQPAVFRHNDCPGVMTAGAALRLAHRHAVACGSQVVVLTANAEGYAAALDLRALGIAIAAIVDLRAEHGPRTAPFADAAAAAGIRILPGHAIYEVLPGASHRVAGIRLAPFPEGAPSEHLACDTVLLSTGFAPAASLLCQAGSRLRYDEVREQFVPCDLPEGVFACGRVMGTYDLEAKTMEARDAGARAAAHAFGRSATVAIAVPPPAEPPSHPWPIVEHPKGKNFVDFDEDLQLRDYRVAIQEGFDSAELLKRFTTNGMGPSQGKHSNMTALRVLARALGKSVGEVGTTTARPFYHPVPMAHLAGRRFHPQRRTSVDAELEALGPVWMDVGQWRRPAYFTRPGASREECIAAEVAAVRERCGLIDIGTLGKVEVFGSEAGELLDRVFTGRFADLPVGRARYALALDEAGFILDEGVVARLGETHYYVTSSTAGSAVFYRDLQRWALLWRLDVTLVNVTGQRAALAIAGPRAAAVVQHLVDLSPTLCHPGGAELTALRAGSGLDDTPAVAIRTSFVGEWAVELHVPASKARALWRALMAVGAQEGLTPFGVEAQRVLRLEKGHPIPGMDTDGLTTPLEAGFAWAVKMDKPFFVGQRSLRIVQGRPSRQVLVGFTLPADAPRPEPCNLVIHNGEIVGRVTSVAASAAVGCTIGLAYVPPALAKPGTPFKVRLTGASAATAQLVTATVAARPFYDRDGLRLRTTPPPPSPTAPLRWRPLTEPSPSHNAAVLDPVPSVVVRRLAGARLGFKGPRAEELACALGNLPAPNRRTVLAGGIQMLRLGLSEFLLDASLAESACALTTLATRLSRGGPGVFPVLREDAALLVQGPKLRDLLLQVCAVDLAGAEEDEVVMTAVAGVPAIATRHSVSGQQAVRLIFDPTWQPYLQSTLEAVAADIARQ